MAGVELTPEEAAQRVLSLLDTDDAEDGLALAMALVEQCPDNMSVLYVAGRACWQFGRRAEAVDFQKRLIACDPSNGQLHRNLFELLMRMDDQPAIATAADAALAAGITDSGLINTGGLAHYKGGNHDRALELFRRAAEIDPANAKAKQNISSILIDRGEEDAAVAVYGESLRSWTSDADDAAQSELIARYDARAATYDANDLHQYFSRYMAGFILEFVPLSQEQVVLDVACGTGGIGDNLKTTGAELWGLDQSPQMLDEARKKGTYESLTVDDMIRGMDRYEVKFDVIVCCGALYHLNRLDAFFSQAAQLLKPDGYLFISVDPAPDDYDIAVSGPGEYAHSRAYLRRLADQAGLHEREIRIAKHRMMPGFWGAFQR